MMRESWICPSWDWHDDIECLAMEDVSPPLHMEKKNIIVEKVKFKTNKYITWIFLKLVSPIMVELKHSELHP